MKNRAPPRGLARGDLRPVRGGAGRAGDADQGRRRGGRRRRTSRPRARRARLAACRRSRRIGGSWRTSSPVVDGLAVIGWANAMCPPTTVESKVQKVDGDGLRVTLRPPHGTSAELLAWDGDVAPPAGGFARAAPARLPLRSAPATAGRRSKSPEPPPPAEENHEPPAVPPPLRADDDQRRHAAQPQPPSAPTSPAGGSATACPTPTSPPTSRSGPRAASVCSSSARPARRGRPRRTGCRTPTRPTAASSRRTGCWPTRRTGTGPRSSPSSSTRPTRCRVRSRAASAWA